MEVLIPTANLPVPCCGCDLCLKCPSPVTLLTLSLRGLCAPRSLCPWEHVSIPIMLSRHCINVTQRLGTLKVQGSLWQNHPAGLQNGFLETTSRIWVPIPPSLPPRPACGSVLPASLQLVTPCACQQASPSQMHSPISPRTLHCSQLPLQHWQLNPYKVTPARERQKSWLGVWLPWKEQLLLFLDWRAAHHADPCLKSRSLEHPEGQAIVWTAVPARKLQAGEMF